MRKALLIAALLVCACARANAPRMFTQGPIQPIGVGCGTMFYTDPLCKPCGTGMKSMGNPINVPYWNSTTTYNPGDWVTYQGDSTYGNRSYWEVPAGHTNTNSPPAGSGGTSTNPDWTESPTPYGGYMLVQKPAGAGVPAYYSMGDTPDADPADPNVCTTSQWQAKWIQVVNGTGATWAAATAAQQNQAMVDYLNTDFDGGFSNTANIYYVATTGSNTTGAVNDPSHPYMTLAPIFTALDTTISQSACGTVSTTLNSATITVNSSTSCVLARSSLITAAGIPANDYIIEQISGTPGGAGQYLLTAAATATNASESLQTGYQPGGVIVIEAGQYPGCPATPSSACLSFQPQDGGNPSWLESGSPGHPLLITSYPGAVVAQTSTSQGSQDIFYMIGQSPPYNAASSLTINGIQFPDPTFAQGYLGVVNWFADFVLERIEYSGWDNMQFGNGTVNDGIRYSVCHDVEAHCIYVDWGTTTGNAGCQKFYMDPGVDTDFWQDHLDTISGANTCGAAYGDFFYGNVIYDSGYDGYDPIHLNGWVLGAKVYGNIMAYSGYMSIDTGQYGVDVNGNLFFDNSGEGIQMYLYANNYASATLNGTTSVSITPTSGPGYQWGVSTGFYILGPCIPVGTTITAVPAGGGGVAGTYTMSAAATCSQTEPVTAGAANGSYNPGPSTMRWNTIRNNVFLMGNGSDLIYGASPSSAIRMYEQTGISYMKDTAILNNVIETYQTGTGQIPLQFWSPQGQGGTQAANTGVYPETYTVSGNIFYNRNTAYCSSNCQVMLVQTGASQTFPAGNYSFSGGTGCDPTTGSFSGCYPSSGNTYAASDPFPNCPESYAQTPWLCDFGSHDLH